MQIISLRFVGIFKLIAFLQNAYVVFESRIEHFICFFINFTVRGGFGGGLLDFVIHSIRDDFGSNLSIDLKDLRQLKLAFWSHCPLFATFVNTFGAYKYKGLPIFQFHYIHRPHRCE